jgi:hypothetical protein
MLGFFRSMLYNHEIIYIGGYLLCLKNHLENSL